MFFLKRSNVIASLILIVATMALSGCIQIKVVDNTPVTPVPTSDVAERRVQEHDLAVLAVDFDPPLEYDKIMDRKKRGEGITLLVAIENTGASIEKNVTVQIKLFKDQDKAAILEQNGVIDGIAPGEIKIFHFKNTDIPFSYQYHLYVQALPVTGETNQADNQKSYDLLISQP